MNRENNRYINLVTGEDLNATEMQELVLKEVNNQNKDFNKLSKMDQMDLILGKWEQLLNSRFWVAYNKGALVYEVD